MTWLRTLLEKLAGWLLVRLWAKEGPKLNSNISVSVPMVGSVPLSSFVSIAGLVPIIAKGMGEGKSAEQIKSDVAAAAPAALIGLSEALLNVIFPGAGTLEAVIVWMVENSKNSEMTQQQVNDWMDRFGAGAQS